MIAALQGDLDTSDGVGKVFFREDSSPEVLHQAAEHINRAFPQDDETDPIQVVVVTWVDVASTEPQSTNKKVSFMWSFRLSREKLDISILANSCLYHTEKHLPVGFCIHGEHHVCYCPVYKRWDTVYLHPCRKQQCAHARWLQQGFGQGFPVF